MSVWAVYVTLILQILAASASGERAIVQAGCVCQVPQYPTCYRCGGEELEDVCSLRAAHDCDCQENIWNSRCPACGVFADLRIQAIHTIEETAFVGIDATDIDLSQNCLHGAQVANIGASNVTRLDLSSNRIADLPDDAFAGLENLESLDLSNNEITADTVRQVFTALQRLTKLRTLKLSHNNLRRLDAETFSLLEELKELQTLELFGNYFWCRPQLPGHLTVYVSPGVPALPPCNPVGCPYEPTRLSAWRQSLLGDANKWALRSSAFQVSNLISMVRPDVALSIDQLAVASYAYVPRADGQRCWCGGGLVGPCFQLPPPVQALASRHDGCNEAEASGGCEHGCVCGNCSGPWGLVPTHARCQSSLNCGAGQYCTANGCAGVCMPKKVGYGYPCSRGEECESESCVCGRCSKNSPLFECPAEFCADGKCLKPAGHDCDHDRDCESDQCLSRYDHLVNAEVRQCACDAVLEARVPTSPGCVGAGALVLHGAGIPAPVLSTGLGLSVELSTEGCTFQHGMLAMYGPPGPLGKYTCHTAGTVTASAGAIGPSATDGNCEWILAPKGAESVTVVVLFVELFWDTALSIEQCHDIECGKTTPLPMSPFSHKADVTSPLMLTSNTPWVRVRHEKSDFVGRGFEVLFAGQQPAGCTAGGEVLQGTGFLSSWAEEPASRGGQRCVWNITEGGPNAGVQLSFVKFDLSLEHHLCVSDLASADESAPAANDTLDADCVLAAEYSGPWLPEALDAGDPERLVLKFQSGDTIHGSGVLALLAPTALHAYTALDTTDVAEVISEESGEITDGVAHWQFNALDKTWIIAPPDATQITLAFSSFSMSDARVFDWGAFTFDYADKLHVDWCYAAAGPCQQVPGSPYTQASPPRPGATITVHAPVLRVRLEAGDLSSWSPEREGFRALFVAGRVLDCQSHRQVLALDRAFLVRMPDDLGFNQTVAVPAPTTTTTITTTTTTTTTTSIPTTSPSATPAPLRLPDGQCEWEFLVGKDGEGASVHFAAFDTQAFDTLQVLRCGAEVSQTPLPPPPEAWSWHSFFSEATVVSQVLVNGSLFEVHDEIAEQGDESDDGEPSVGCPAGWTQHSGACWWISGESLRAGCKQAQAFCRSLGANLASVHSHEEMDFVVDLVRVYGDEWLDSWLGLNRYDGLWQWFDGSIASYADWAPGQPYGCQECVEFRAASRAWSGSFCDMPTSNAFVCKGDPDSVSAAQTPVTLPTAGCPSGWTEHDGHCWWYSTTINTGCLQAQDWCRSFEANLATITSEVEFRWMFDWVGQTLPTWIGLNKFGGTWQWFDGSNSAYRFWQLDHDDPFLSFGQCATYENYFGIWEHAAWESNFEHLARPFVCKRPIFSPTDEAEADEEDPAESGAAALTCAGSPRHIFSGSDVPGPLELSLPAARLRFESDESIAGGGVIALFGPSPPPNHTCDHGNPSKVTDQFGVISDGPSEYSNPTDCRWTIAPVGAQEISLAFVDLKTYREHFVHIETCSDELCADASPIAGSPFGGYQRPAAVSVPSSVVRVTFNPTWDPWTPSSSGRGFELAFAAGSLPACDGASVDSPSPIARHAGIVATPPRYSHDVDCSWDINGNVSLTFLVFNTERYMDHLSITRCSQSTQQGAISTPGSSLTSRENQSAAITQEIATVTVELAVTEEEFAAMRDAYIAAVAAAFGVPAENVEIVRVTPVANRRTQTRVLLAAGVEVETSITLAEDRPTLTDVTNATQLQRAFNENFNVTNVTVTITGEVVIESMVIPDEEVHLDPEANSTTIHEAPKVSNLTALQMNTTTAVTPEMSSGQQNASACENGAECGPGGSCFEFPGGHQCNCTAGWHRSEDGRSCADVDECENGARCGGGGSCFNLAGGYTCNCSLGWMLSDDGLGCDDVNECERDADCGPAGTCSNTDGAYICLCAQGWRMSAEGMSCVDVDECVEISDICDLRASCNNLDGGFSCTCPPGWLSFDEGRMCVQPEQDFVPGDNCTCSEAEGVICHDLAYCHGTGSAVPFPAGAELTQVAPPGLEIPADSDGKFLCMCSSELIGHGYGADGCDSKGYAVRIVYSNTSRLSAAEEETLLALLGNLTCQRGSVASCDHLHYTTHRYDLGVNVLFHHTALEAANRAASHFNSLFTPGGRRALSPPPQVDPEQGARVYVWNAAGTSAFVPVPPSGMQLLSVHFEAACGTSGCWALRVQFTTGSSDTRLETFNTFFLPYAVGSDALSFDYDYRDHHILESFQASNFPCRVSDYVSRDGSTHSLPARATACCFGEAFDATQTSLGGDGDGRGLLGTYRVTTAFAAYAEDAYPVLCPGGHNNPQIDDFAGGATTPKPEDFFPDGSDTAGHHADEFLSVGQKFVGMPLSPGIVSRRTLDAFVGKFEATIKLDEQELRTKAGLLRGSAGVEHTVDFFLGFANFKPAATTWMLDSLATQAAVHVEKTAFFTAATHGTNDYTFLEYVNLRLIAVYREDTVFSGSAEALNRSVRTDPENQINYVQVTFSLGSQYRVDDDPESFPLIPLDSVRAGYGTFVDEARDYTQKCSEYKADLLAFNDSVLTDQPCAPKAVMCVSPKSILDSFVAFNIPLGTNYFAAADTSSDTLENNIFVDMVISATEVGPQAPMSPNDGGEPMQMKTTLSASLPIVDGGVNIFCDGVTAKTDLKDVADVDIIVGIAADSAELSRLRVLKDVAGSQLDPQGEVRVDSDSIEAGLMTLVLKGNASYFDGPSLNTRGVSLELEDVITIHLMEADDVTAGTESKQKVVAELLAGAPDDNSDAAGLLTDGYALNGAFSFTVDRSSQRAHLEPSERLLAACPLNPPRPSVSNNVVLDTCVTRRDVRYRNFPWRSGGASTAMEVNSAAAEAQLTSESDESLFLTTILGDSDYSRRLGSVFAAAIVRKYGLNGRYRRAFWVNPGYEWAPTHSGGLSLFQLSQKVFLFALVTLEERLSDDPGRSIPGAAQPKLPPARRALLTVLDAEAASSVSSAALSFPISREKLLSSALAVPSERVATLLVRVTLTELEACMPREELQSELRALMEHHMREAGSAVESVQVMALTVAPGNADCGSRRADQAWLGAGGEVGLAYSDTEVVVLFAESDQPTLDLSALAAVPRIVHLVALSVPDGIRITSQPSPLPFSSSSSGEESDPSTTDSSMDKALVLGLASAAGVMLLAGGAFAQWWRGRSIASTSRGELSSGGREEDMADSAAERIRALKAELAIDNFNRARTSLDTLDRTESPAAGTSSQAKQLNFRVVDVFA